MCILFYKIHCFQAMYPPRFDQQNVVAMLFSGGWLAKRLSIGRGRGVSNAGISEGGLTFAPWYPDLVYQCIKHYYY